MGKEIQEDNLEQFLSSIRIDGSNIVETDGLWHKPERDKLSAAGVLSGCAWLMFIAAAVLFMLSMPYEDTRAVTTMPVNPELIPGRLLLGIFCFSASVICSLSGILSLVVKRLPIRGSGFVSLTVCGALSFLAVIFSLGIYSGIITV